ncbi:MAG TPA: hypothetical protein VFH70_00595 [Acidimicrobiales bacterium]|nr:hypothetical protein [Acidimicrobiales bacterium]
MSTPLIRGRARPVRGLAALTAVLLAGGAAGAYQVGARQGRPPQFLRGGVFGAQAPAFAPPQGVAMERPSAVPAGATVPSTTPPPAADPVAATTSTTAPPSDIGPFGLPVPGPPPGSAPAADRAPPAGTYTYALSGQESVTGFGSRQFPASMTIVVHGARGLAPEEEVLDIHLSDQHNEREILAYRPGSIDLDFEAGSITFGPMTQTSQGDYSPPMGQVPWPARAGASLGGVSAARASDGSTARTEDWTANVTGAEVVQAAGTPVNCPVIVVQRKTRPGSSDQETRHVTYWYDPGRHIWAKWAVLMHGERSYAGFTFTYDENMTATLTGFQAA